MVLGETLGPATKLSQPPDGVRVSAGVEQVKEGLEGPLGQEQTNIGAGLVVGVCSLLRGVTVMIVVVTVAVPKP